jgi:hypothetical protein
MKERIKVTVLIMNFRVMVKGRGLQAHFTKVSLKTAKDMALV